ncbi:2-hydroxychromene-2-carboxylate isomerase [Rubritepida flocculans]|uniref:2-hydroxychromene-2-carboxylate isomerase n=1 Tax=Rubritepida flocculans TaxID=182403 RepID=UPI0003F4BC4E|nr:2-hydroxychromene-2-carboxylate isomerase [Rubritepida flocculans]
MHVDCYASLNSPWAYLGARRIETLCARYGATLRLWPVDFSVIFPASGGLPLPRRAPQRQAYRLVELARWRDHLGLPLTLAPRHFPVQEAPLAQAVIALREREGDAPAIRLAHRIMAAIWADDANPADPATFAALAAECGLDGPALLRAAEDPRWAAMRQADSEAALAKGVFGAPSYVIEGEIFWGQDRLDFVERRLARG